MLILRGLGSGAAVLLTVLVTRYLATEPAATFLIMFNFATIAAVLFRWGMDDVIIRRVASAPTKALKNLAASRLLAMAHWRVGVWVIVTTAVAVGVLLLYPSLLPSIQLNQILAMIIVASLIGLSASGGRAYQGNGQPNRATLVLNILIPAATVAILLIFVFLGPTPTAEQLFAIYGCVTLTVYFSVVWVFPVGRPRFAFNDTEIRNTNAIDRVAANQLGGVVVAQQLLNWAALIFVPAAFGPSVFVSFNLNFKIASLVSLVMFAINFTFAARLASLYAAQNFEKLRKLTISMLGAVVAASFLFGAVLLLLRSQIYDFSKIEQRLDLILLYLVLGQIFFAISAVFSLVLTMAHQERFLLWAQGTTNVFGAVLLCVLCYFTSIEWVSLSFLIAYGILTPILGYRVAKILRKN